VTTEPLFKQGALEEAIAAPRLDILGGHISTIRNYNFAILPYLPTQGRVQAQAKDPTAHRRASRRGVERAAHLPSEAPREPPQGHRRGRRQGLIAREKRLYDKDPERALSHLREKIAPHIEGPNGVAADVAKLINDFADENPTNLDRTLVLIGRTGALYPFFRSSALLKHIDGKTRNLPVVLLYPGERKDTTALSFPERVVEKCEQDPSLAVAHKCFWHLWPEKAYAWELRLQDEIRPDFTIDEPDSDEARRAFLSDHRDKADEILAAELKRRERKAQKEADSERSDGPLFAGRGDG